MNTYTYVGNNPISYVDPLGLYTAEQLAASCPESVTPAVGFYPFFDHRKKMQTGADVLVTRHLHLPNIMSNFNLDIWFGSRHDVAMETLNKLPHWRKPVPS